MHHEKLSPQGPSPACGPMGSRSRRQVRAILACVGLAFLTGCFESWVTTCPGEKFCFEHPDYLADTGEQATDTVAGKHEGKGLTLHYDYGKDASDFPELETNPTRVVRVGDDLKGRLIDARAENNLMALTVSASDGGPRLSILVHASENLDEDMATRILKSVRIHAK